MKQFIYIKADETKVIEHREAASLYELTVDEKNYFDYLQVRVISNYVIWAKNVREDTSKSVSIQSFSTINADQVPNHVKAYVLLLD